jgi:DNA replication protein DnaC
VTLLSGAKQTNAHRCLLRNACPLAGDPAACTPRCGYFIGLAGTTGTGARIAAANVPADYRNVTLEDSPARESQAFIYAKLADYVTTFERQFDEDYAVSSPDKRIKSLYLYSEEPGTGKTLTASALINSWITRHYIGRLQRGLTPLQRAAYFWDANQSQTLYNEFNRSKVPDHIAEPAAAKYYTGLQYAKEAPFVVIDDLGTRSITEGHRADIHSVINHRVTERKPTIYTSNVTIEELPDIFGEQRLADRIGDLTMPLSFGGTSRRGIRR